MSAPLAPLDAGLTPAIRESIDQLVVLAAANQIGDKATAAKAYALLQEAVAGLGLSLHLPRPRTRRSRPVVRGIHRGRP